MNTQYSKKEIRTWAIIMATILTVIGTIQYLVWGHDRAASVFWIIAVFFFIPGLLIPQALRPVYQLWLKLALILAWVNTRIIMFAAFFLVFTPIGLVTRLLRIDLIKQRWDRKAETYWIKRPEEPFDPERYEKQY